MAATATAAAAAIRHLHHRPSLPSTTQKTATHCTLRLPLFQLCLLKSQLFVTRTPLEALFQSQSRHPFYRRRLCAASVYNEFDDGFDEDDAELGDEQPPPPPSRSSAPDDARRLYVGNLPFTMTPSDLSELFSQAGNIDAVELVYDRVTDRSRGFAFITMGSVEEANEAIRMFDGSQVGGRTVKVNFPEVPRGGEREAMGPKPRRGSRTFVSSPYKVYAGNLGWALTSQSLRDAFAGQRGLLGARVVYDRDSGLSRGFGFLSFESPEDAESAIEAMNGQELEGRPLRLSLAVGKPSTSLSQASLADQSTERISVVEPY